MSIEVTQIFVGICHMQLCGPKDATDEELLAVANRKNPSGTRNGWMRVIRSGQGEPVVCAEQPERSHFVAVC